MLTPVLTVDKDIRQEQLEKRQMVQQLLSCHPQQELPEEAGEPPADLKLPCRVAVPGEKTGRQTCITIPQLYFSNELLGNEHEACMK